MNELLRRLRHPTVRKHTQSLFTKESQISIIRINSISVANQWNKSLEVTPMLLRRWISIPLALIAILCVAFCIFIFFFTVYPSVSPDFSYISLVALGPTSLVLCIVLLTCSCKRVNPLQITVWGAGVLFLSIPTILRFPLLGYAGRIPFPIYLGLLNAAPIIFMLSGIGSCLFAWALNKHRMNGTLVDSLTTMPVPQPVGMMTVDKVTNLLLILNRVKQSNTMPAEEYEQKRKNYLNYLTRQM